MQGTHSTYNEGQGMSRLPRVQQCELLPDDLSMPVIPCRRARPNQQSLRYVKSMYQNLKKRSRYSRAQILSQPPSGRHGNTECTTPPPVGAGAAGPHGVVSLSTINQTVEAMRKRTSRCERGKRMWEGQEGKKKNTEVVIF